MSRVLWFSPLPPARTDIANYTARLIPHLAARSDLQLVHPDGAMVDPAFNASPISSLTPRDLNMAEVCIYQLGNNAQQHAAIFECAERHPGVVVLHDWAINEFILGMYAQDQERAGQQAGARYRQAMGRWYGLKGLQAATRVLEGRERPSVIAADFPLFETALHNALAAVCHNPIVCEELRYRFPKLPILTLPLPFAQPSVTRTRPVKSDGNVIRLAMFGYMAENRRLDAFLDVWALSPHRERFSLDIVGELDDQSALSSFSRSTGLRDRIRFHGFLPERELDEIIASSNMVLNLRNPTMGEASGSQLRIWANGTASAVSDCGWYSLLPASSAYKIGIETESADLAHLLERLATASLDLEALAQTGREMLEGHDPEAYVSKLVAWLESSSAEMKSNWAESRMMGTVAQAYATSLPRNLPLALPPALLTECAALANDIP